MLVLDGLLHGLPTKRTCRVDIRPGVVRLSTSKPRRYALRSLSLFPSKRLPYIPLPSLLLSGFECRTRSIPNHPAFRVRIYRHLSWVFPFPSLLLSKFKDVVHKEQVVEVFYAKVVHLNSVSNVEGMAEFLLDVKGAALPPPSKFPHGDCLEPALRGRVSG